MLGSVATVENDLEVNAEFGTTVRAVDVDAVLAEAYRDADTAAPVHLKIDLSAATFVETVALQMLTATMLDVRQRGGAITIRVPKERRARDFLRAWGYPDSVNKVLGGGRNFWHMTAEADRAYFGEKPRYYLPNTLPAHPGFSGADLSSNNFFGFRTIQLNSTSDSPRPAYEEKDFWNFPHIQSILNKKLGGGESYYASRIVFEAIMNAIRHPGARVMQTASFSDANSDRTGSFFTTHFWDDGVSMIDTISNALKQGKGIRSTVDPEFSRAYLIISSRDDVPGEDRLVSSSDMVLDAKTIPAIALFSTILPGVTSDLVSTAHRVAEELVEVDERFGRRGMGLFILVNAVVEVLDGSVSFRTARHFMNVRRPSQRERDQTGAQLRVRIKERPPYLPPFKGNLVTVRLRSQLT